MSLSVTNLMGGGGTQSFPNFTWEKYNIISTIVRAYDNPSTRKDVYTKSSTTSAFYVYYSSTYTYDETTHMYTLTSPSSTNLNNGAYTNMSAGKYYILGAQSGSTMLYNYTSNVSAIYNESGTLNGYVHVTTGNDYLMFYHEKESTLEYVEDVLSTDYDAYPIDGIKDGYYYKIKDKPIYAWNKYSTNSYSSEVKTIDGSYTVGNSQDSCVLYQADSYTYDESTGMYTLVNPTSKTITAYTSITSICYFSVNSATTNVIGKTITAEGNTRVQPNGSSGLRFYTAATSYPFKVYESCTRYKYMERIADKTYDAYPNGDIHIDDCFYRYVNNGLNVWCREDIGSSYHINKFPTYSTTSEDGENSNAYIGNFENIPTVYYGSSIGVDNETGELYLNGSISSFTPTSSRSDFISSGLYVSIGSTRAKNMWYTDGQCTLYWNSNNDYWFVNRYSQYCSTKISAMKSECDVLKDTAIRTLRSGNGHPLTIYYSTKYTQHDDGTFELTNPSSRSVGFINTLQLDAGYYYTIDSPISDTMIATTVNSTYRITLYNYHSVYIVPNTSVTTYASIFKKSNDHWFRELVVSDDAKQYPTLGVSNGYWYKKLGIDALQIASGSFTWSTSSQKKITFEHGIGIAPKYVMLFCNSIASYSTSGVSNFWSSNFSPNLIIGYNSGAGILPPPSEPIITETSYTCECYSTSYYWNTGNYNWYAFY